VALRDSVKDLFRRAREDLGVTPGTAGIYPPRTSLARASFRPTLRAELAAAPDAGERGVEARKVSFWKCKIGSFGEKLGRWARNHELKLDWTIVSMPDEAYFSMAPYSYQQYPAHCVARCRLEGVWRGRYGYKVTFEGHKSIAQDQDDLDLTQTSQPVIQCKLDSEVTSCNLVDVQSDKECPP